MSQLDGGVSVDEGFRVRFAGQPSTSGEPSRSAPGSDLGAWGVDDWHLPGFGESGPRCGEWYPRAVCDEHGHVDMTTHTCGRRTCPDCWSVWAHEAGVRATKRIQAFRYTQPDDYRRQVAHAVVSPAEGEVMNERQFYQWRSKAGEIAEEKGFRGFAVIPHPFRATEETIAEYRAEEPDVGLWVWIRERVDGVEELLELARWSPHYHIIGATSPDMEPGDDDGEAVYRFIRSMESFDGIRDTESHEDVYGAFRYLYSHAGWPEGSTRDATTWYGDLANSVFVENATEEWQSQKPSEGVMSALERAIEEVAGPTEESDEEGAGGDESDDLGECPVGDCGGVLIDVFDVSAYLRTTEPPPEVAERMKTARDWRLGRIEPPPGLKRPTSEEQAHEAIEEMTV